MADRRMGNIELLAGGLKAEVARGGRLRLLITISAISSGAAGIRRVAALSHDRHTKKNPDVTASVRPTKSTVSIDARNLLIKLF